MQIIEDLKTKILQNNNIFGQNGFFFKNTYQFIESGISDRMVNQFYFRYLKPGTDKFRVKSDLPLKTVTVSVRFIAQFTNRIDQQEALHSLLFQLTDNCKDEISIVSYSDDTKEIFKSEHKIDAVIRDFHLISVDLNITQETVFSDCISTCLSC